MMGNKYIYLLEGCSWCVLRVALRTARVSRDIYSEIHSDDFLNLKTCMLALLCIINMALCCIYESGDDAGACVGLGPRSCCVGV